MRVHEPPGAAGAARLTPLVLLWRALLLRCPRCGKGALYRRGYAMYAECPVCGWRYEREEGYWTGAMAINLVIAELLIAVAVVPASVILAVNHLSLWPLVWALPLPVALPFLFYWHSKSLWMAIDIILHPVAPR